jgi:hypothetical protein
MELQIAKNNSECLSFSAKIPPVSLPAGSLGFLDGKLR